MSIGNAVTIFIAVCFLLFVIRMAIVIRRMEKPQAEKVYGKEEKEKLIRHFNFQFIWMRIVGWSFFVVGGIWLLVEFPKLFDSEATVLVDGVATASMVYKIRIVAFLSCFAIIGAFFSLTPKKRLELFFFRFLSFSERFYFAATKKP